MQAPKKRPFAIIGGKKVHTRAISAHVPEPVYDKIRQIAESNHESLQAVFCEAINMLLKDRNMKPFAIDRAKPGRPRREDYLP